MDRLTEYSALADHIDLNKFSSAQLEEIEKGRELSLPFHLYAIPSFTPAEMSIFRSTLEASEFTRCTRDSRYIATEYGAEQVSTGNMTFGFKSETNYTKYPFRVCYIPELWDPDDGPGYTAQNFLDLCDGDKDKADLIFARCDWQHPTTALDEWDSDDTLSLIATKQAKIRALEREVQSLAMHVARDLFDELPTATPSLADRISDAVRRNPSKVSTVYITNELDHEH